MLKRKSRVFNTLGLAEKSGYNIDNNCYKRNKVLEGRQYYHEVGDEKDPMNFHPQVKIKGFDNDANLSVRLLGHGSTFITEEQGDKIRVKYDKVDCEFYDLAENRFEFGVVLKVKPDDRKVRFSIRHKNVSFFKFPTPAELETELGLEGVTIREEMQGGYSIFHTGQTYAGRFKSGYTTGKFMEIPCPWAEDANGNRVWCDLNIDPEANTMDITLPRSFHENATYPVYVDPDFGQTSVPGADSTAPGDQLCFIQAAQQLINAAADKEIQAVGAYVRMTVGSGSIDVGVYDLGVANNNPNGATLVGTPQTIAAPVGGSLVKVESAELGDALTAGNNYTVSCGNVVQVTGALKIGLDGLSNAVCRSTNAGALAATYNRDLGDASWFIGMYATYGDQPGPPIFSGTIPNYQGPRTTPVTIATASYFTNPETFTANNLPAGANINSTTGVISWALPIVGVTNNIDVTCTNGLGNDTSNTFSITIDAQVPTFDTAITNKTGNRTNAITPYDASVHFTFADSFSATGLPDGLSIDSGTGVISGAPSIEQSYTGVYVTATNVDGSVNSNTFTWDIGAPLPIPTITDINSGNGIQRTQEIIITGTFFESPQGGGTLTFNGDSITPTTWTDTEIRFNAPSEGYILGNSYTLEIINDSGYNITSSEQFLPQVGYNYVTLAKSYLQLPADSFLDGVTGLEALAVGDQIIYQTAASPAGTISVNTDGVAQVTNATVAGDYTFNYMINDISDLTVSSNGVAIVTFQASDSDITAPSWVSSPAVANVTTVSANATATIGELGSIFLVVVPNTETTPSPAQVVAGQNAAGGAPTFADSATTTTAINSTVLGLTESTQYKFCFVAQDDEPTPNVQASVTLLNVTTAAELDITPPDFVTAPAVSQVTQTTAIVNASINEVGTIYYAVFDARLPDPSISEVVSGIVYSQEDNENVGAAARGEGAALDDVLVNGLFASTQYKFSFVAIDADGNSQLNPTIILATTSAASAVRSVTETIKDRDTGALIANKTLNYQIQTAWGVISDVGQTTTDGSGVLLVSNLVAAAGSAQLIISDPATNDGAPPIPVTVVEA